MVKKFIAKLIDARHGLQMYRRTNFYFIEAFEHSFELDGLHIPSRKLFIADNGRRFQIRPDYSAVEIIKAEKNRKPSACRQRQKQTVSSQKDGEQIPAS